MRKKTILIVVIVVLLALLSVTVFGIKYFSKEKEDLFNAAKQSIQGENKTVVATVNGTPIYKESIDVLIAANRLSIKNAEKDGLGYKVPEKTQEEILKELIRNIVIVDEAKAQNIEVSYEEANKAFRSAYEVAQKTQNSENAQLLKEYLESLNYTEEEYIAAATESYQKEMIKSKLLEQFSKQYAEKNYQELMALFNEYIDGLVEKAEIIYK